MKIAYLGHIDLKPLFKGYNGGGMELPPTIANYPFGAALVNEFLRGGHEVAVFATGRQCELKIINLGKCTVYILPYRKYRSQLLTLFTKESRIIKDCLQQFKPDVVFAQWTYEYARAAIVSGYPSLIVVRDSPWKIVKYNKNVVSLLRALFATVGVFPFAKNYSAVSPTMAEDVKRLIRRVPEIRVIPNAISESKIADQQTLRPILSTKKIVCITNGSALKNTRILITAFSKLSDRHKDWQLILIGQTTEKSGMYDLWMQERGMKTANVKFCGYLDQASIRKVLLEDADIFVSATLEESFGMVFVEAMSSGVPCIGGESSGAVPWVLNYGKAGLLCDVKSVDSLGCTIEKLMGDVDLRTRIRNEALRYIKENFTLSRVAAMYIEEFRKIIAHSKKEVGYYA